ncbi:MAG: hypothetical protein V4520_18440 [Bacteroidota bacterium]
MKRTFLIATLLLLIVGSAIALLNHFILSTPVHHQLNSDPRNSGIDLSAHYQYYCNPSVLILNLKDIGNDKAPADIFRAFLQASNSLKDKNFDVVVLECRGNPKFKLSGKYFNKLGTEYEQQNPVYTIRTFPENVMNLDGSHAFGSVTGGVFGVLKLQMEQFGEFTNAWYLNDFTSKN